MARQLRCGRNRFTGGRVVRAASAVVPVHAFDYAKELAEKAVYKNAKTFVDGCECPDECEEMDYNPKRDVSISYRRLWGRPDRHLRGYYRIAVEARYDVQIFCRPIEVWVDEPPEDDTTDSGSSGGGTGTGGEGESGSEVEEPVECEGPNPAVSYSSGTRLFEEILRLGPLDDIGQNARREEIERNEKDLAAAALQTLLRSVECGEGCKAAVEPASPAVKTQTELLSQGVTFRYRVEVVLDEDVRAVCVPE